MIFLRDFITGKVSYCVTVPEHFMDDVTVLARYARSKYPNKTVLIVTGKDLRYRIQRGHKIEKEFSVIRNADGFTRTYSADGSDTVAIALGCLSNILSARNYIGSPFNPQFINVAFLEDIIENKVPFLQSSNPLTIIGSVYGDGESLDKARHK